MSTRAELKRDYKKLTAPMGVFVLRNTRNNRFQVQASRNLKAAINRLKIEITPATNPNRDLLADWNTMGPEAFEIRVLDELEPKDEPEWNPDDDLKELQGLWLARLLEEGGRPY